MLAASLIGAIPVPVVIRSRNDGPLIGETLKQVLSQTVPCTVHVFDNDSTDSTVQVLASLPVQVHRVPAGTYVPGPVLNRAMEIVDSNAPFVVFLNSDCTPLDNLWLETLIEGFLDDSVGAVFGRQVPRPDCLPLFAKDTEDTFGDGSRQIFWKHCFSMASSAIRRSCWQQSPFRGDIKYSEDIDWTWRARQRGWTIRYQKDSQVYHSHNYTLAQFYKRQRGEGAADASIFTWSPWERSLLRYSLLPFMRQVKSDLGYALRNHVLQAAFSSIPLRFVQMTGRRKGFMETMRKNAQHPEKPI